MMEARYALIIILLCTVVGLSACKDQVSRVGDEVHACLLECSPGDHMDGDVLRIVSLNVFHGFPDFDNLEQRLDHIARTLRSSKADVVFLQEVPWRKDIGLAAEYISRATGLNYAYVRANGNYKTIRFEEGLAILSPHPLTNPRYTELEPKPGGFEHRAALAVTARTGHGDINLVTTHLSYSRDNGINAGQVESLRRFVDSLGEGPGIVAGDFNAHEASPQIRGLSEMWIDSYRTGQPASAGRTCCYRRGQLESKNRGPAGFRADYIFLVGNGSNWQVLDSRLAFNEPEISEAGYLWPSNHIGVQTDARLTSGPRDEVEPPTMP